MIEMYEFDKIIGCVKTLDAALGEVKSFGMKRGLMLGEDFSLRPDEMSFVRIENIVYERIIKGDDFQVVRAFYDESSTDFLCAYDPKKGSGELGLIKKEELPLKGCVLYECIEAI